MAAGHQFRSEALGRMRRIEGQVRGVEKMLQEERACVDILIQLSAIKSAVNKTANLILKDHLESCLTAESGDGADCSSLDQVVLVLDKFIK